jgi:SAM-dependent methyltransferase
VSGTLTATEAVIWHEVECGGYADDLDLWAELAERHGGPALDLGCGTGRVALRLAARGREVWAVDSDPRLIAELEERAAGRRLRLTALVGDCREFALDRRFDLVIAPMQLVQLLGGAGGRTALLDRVRTHLAEGGLFAAAVIEGVPAAALADDDAALPDVREVGGTVYSSLPLGAGLSGGTLEVHRLRQVVSSAGDMRKQVHRDRLDVLDAAALEAEAGSCGLRPAGRREIPAGDAHVGSTVVLLERGG